jgi:hypothetical protein
MTRKVVAADMNDLRIQFDTGMTVAQCAQAFHDSIKASYGAGRRIIRTLSALRGSDEGGIEFFEPSGGLPHPGNESPSWKGGAFVPGHSKWHGVTRMAVHAYVIDHGRSRTVQLVGPYGMGDKGSTSRLLSSVASGFGVDASTL